MRNYISAHLSPSHPSSDSSFHVRESWLARGIHIWFHLCLNQNKVLLRLWNCLSSGRQKRCCRIVLTLQSSHFFCWIFNSPFELSEQASQVSLPNLESYKRQSNVPEDKKFWLSSSTLLLTYKGWPKETATSSFFLILLGSLYWAVLVFFCVAKLSSGAYIIGSMNHWVIVFL